MARACTVLDERGKLLSIHIFFNPLTALDVYISPKTVVAYIDYSASHSQNIKKPCLYNAFSIEERNCYKMVYNTLLLC